MDPNMLLAMMQGGGQVPYSWPASCDGCRGRIQGLRYRCISRVNFDFCSQCFEKRSELQMSGHNWSKMTNPSVPPETITEKIVKYRWPASCDGCRSSICGLRYKCKTRVNFDFCSDCFEKRSSKGMSNHNWTMMITPDRTEPVDEKEEAPQDTGYTWPASCDGCRGGIKGFRYKCESRNNYDLCNVCFQKRVHLGMGKHNWKKMVDPKTTPTLINEKAAEAVIHNASCDGCRNHIKGIRWNCLTRTDFDLCSNCHAKRAGLGMSHHNWGKMVEVGKVSEIIKEQPETQSSAPPTNPMMPMMMNNPMMQMMMNNQMGGVMQQPVMQQQSQPIPQVSGEVGEVIKEVTSMIECVKKIDAEMTRRGECRMGYCHYLPKLGYPQSMLSMTSGEEYLICAELCDKILMYMDQQKCDIFFPNYEQTKILVQSLSRDSVAKHAKRSIMGYFGGLWDERKKKAYWDQLQRFPGAMAYVKKRLEDMKYSEYENRMYELPKDKRFVLPTDVAPPSGALFNDKLEDYEDPYEMIRAADPSIPLKAPANELKEDSNNRMVWTDFRKRHTSKIVFSKSGIDVNESSDEKLCNSFVFGKDEIHGRCIWAHAIRYLAIAKDKRTGEWVYPAEQFSNKSHFNRNDFYAEFCFHLFVNGKKIIVKGSPFGEILTMDQRGDDDRGTNFFKSTQSCRLYVSLTDGKQTKWNIFDDFQSRAQKFNTIFRTLTAGKKHKIRIEMSYRLKVLSDSLDADTPLFPSRDTLRSHPIAAGEFELEIPRKVPDLPNPFPVYSCTMPNGREVLQQVETFLRESGEWGQRNDKKEELIYCVAEGDLYPLYGEYWDKNRREKVRYTKQYGLEIRAVMYRNPQNGWSHEHCRIFKLGAYTPETNIGVNQNKKMPPLLRRFGVGGSDVVEVDYVPDAIWEMNKGKVRRCTREMADYYVDLKPEDLKRLGRDY